MKIQDFARATTPLIQSLNGKNWNQIYGKYSAEGPCCIGAHLAHFFDRNEEDYWDGVVSASKFLSCTTGQVSYLFWAAGAPSDPFSSEPWPADPPITTIWENLAQIEELPPTFAIDAFDWVKAQRKRFGLEAP